MLNLKVKIFIFLTFFYFSQLFPQKPVYPIIFIHGLDSNDKTWKETIYFMADNYLWDDPFSNNGVFHAVLNGDYNSSSYKNDVKVFDQISPNNLYCINFDGVFNSAQNEIIPYVSHGIYGESESNESAITKQGYALSLMINKVLEVTGASKVILVGHSMGGLAAREYLQRQEEGKHKWWNDAEGHHVAKLVTIGTPHLGSNASLGGIEQFKVDVFSEAIRDLRWSFYKTKPWIDGVYLFGGDEKNVPPLYHEEDVNCDGDDNDSIEGINAGRDLTFDNPNMPLPVDLEYTWIVSDEGTSVGGDWVVDLDRQWLYDLHKRPVPFGLAETIITHRAHWNEIKDYESIMKGLDEPDHINTAYQIEVDESYHIFATHQEESYTDVDYFKMSINQSGVYRFRLANIPGFFQNNSISLEIIAEDKTTIRKKQTNTNTNQIEFYLTSSELIDDTLYIKITYNIPYYQKKSWLYPLTLSVDLIGPPYQLYAYANPSGIEANNVQKTVITAEILDFVGNISKEKGHSVLFNIIQGQDFGILEGENPVMAENGKVQIQLKATTISGKIDVEVSSSGLKKDTITIFSKDPGTVTKVKGHLTSDTKWTLANSPYEVIEDLYIDQGVVLTIEPGVVIKFRENTDLVVRGGMIAKGKPSYPIIFTSSDKRLPGAWGGISFEATAIKSQCIMEYCEISYAGDDSWAVGYPIRLNLNANPVIRNTKIFNSRINAVGLVSGDYNSDIRIDNPGLPLWVSDDIRILQGAVLTIAPGSVFKLVSNADFIINGGFIARGTSEQPIIFTSYKDDLYYGDTNNDGSSDPLPGDWGGVQFNKTAISDQSVIEFCEFYYAGDDSWGAGFPIRLNLYANPLIQYTNVYKCRINAVGLVGGDYNSDIRIENPELPLWVSDDIRILQGAVLTIAPGCLFKLIPNADFIINGGFIARGTSEQPIIFTSYKDDHYYGDTNNDGSSDPLPGDWGGIQFNSTAIGKQCELNYCELYYAGDDSWGTGYPIVCDQEDVLVQNTLLKHSKSHGIYIKTNGAPDLGGGKRDSHGNNVFYDYNDKNRFAVYNNSPNDIAAKNNFWTTLDSSEIAENIFDYYDNASKGKVLFSGYKSLPPTKPILLEPQNNTITANQNVIFSWEQSNDAEGEMVIYTLHISSSANDTSVHPITESSIQFNGIDFFQPDSSYNWYVTSSDGENMSTSTDTFTLFYHLPTTIEDKSVFKPEHWRLYQNYPNPFNNTTRIKYSLAAGSRVQIILYNVLGQKICTLLNGYKSAGIHELQLNMDTLSSGVYFYSIILNKVNKRITRKMVLLK